MLTIFELHCLHYSNFNGLHFSSGQVYHSSPDLLCLQHNSCCWFTPGCCSRAYLLHCAGLGQNFSICDGLSWVGRATANGPICTCMYCAPGCQVSIFRTVNSDRFVRIVLYSVHFRHRRRKVCPRRMRQFFQQAHFSSSQVYHSFPDLLCLQHH